MRDVLASIALVIALTLSGCLAISVDGKPKRGHGPPPHAPDHGYRHHHQGTEIAFDAGIGVYAVLGYPKHYYSEGRFLRLHGTSWQESASLNGPWIICSSSSLPPSLRKLHPSKAKGLKGKGNAPAKGRW